MHLRFAYAALGLATVGLLGCHARAGEAHGTGCLPLSTPTSRAMQLVHAVARVPVSATDPSWAGFAHEERGVSFEGQCLTVTAVSWNGLHSGAIVVRDSAGKIIFSDTTYRDPRNL